MLGNRLLAGRVALAAGDVAEARVHLEVARDSHGQWRVKDISGTRSLEVDGVSSLEALVSPGSTVVMGALQLRVRKVQPAGDRTEAAPAFVPGRLEEGTVLGVAPELVELGDVVAASPELSEAIRDPNVRAMLKDEKTKKELAQLLMLASKKSGSAPPQAS